MPKISSSLLNARLRLLVDDGIAIRKRIPEKRGFENFLTSAGKGLAPLLTELGAWGKTWVYDDMSEDDTDVESLVRGIALLLDIDQLPDGDLVFQFTFTDVDKHPM